jgi:Zn-finger protein
MKWRLEMRLEWEGKGFSFFQNIACEYFPCHRTSSPETFNCLFCYCPLYALDDKCGGDFRLAASGVKDCSGCAIPHERGNYWRIAGRFSEINEMISKNRKKL